ncbi:hypothetical protein Hanom_Chr01g00089131 [Helianthus anomalus]
MASTHEFLIVYPWKLLGYIPLQCHIYNNIFITLPYMNGPFVFWKRVLNFCWIKFPCTESNVQVTVERFVFSLLSYLFLYNTKKETIGQMGQTKK